MFFNVMKNIGSGLRPGYEANSHFDSDNKNIVSLGLYPIMISMKLLYDMHACFMQLTFYICFCT